MTLALTDSSTRSEPDGYHVSFAAAGALAFATGLLAEGSPADARPSEDVATDLIIGLCLVTGRTPWDLAVNTQCVLEPYRAAPYKGAGTVILKFHVSFVLADTTHKIPVLTPASLVIEAFQRLRSLMASDGALSPQDFSEHWENRLDVACRQSFGPLFSGLPPDGYGDDVVDIGVLQHLYALICHQMDTPSGGEHPQSLPLTFLEDVLALTLSPHRLTTLSIDDTGLMGWFQSGCPVSYSQNAECPRCHGSGVVPNVVVDLRRRALANRYQVQETPCDCPIGQAYALRLITDD